MSREDVTIHILRKVVVDGFILCGLSLSIYATVLFWQPFQRGFFCGDESLMFPYRDDTVTVPMLRGVGITLPLLAFLICEWVLLRKQEDDIRCLRVRIPAWIRGFYCAAISFAMGLCFSELVASIAKNTIGRLRPHFFDLCRPSIDCSSPEWQGRYIQPHEYTCTGNLVDRFKDMRMSFLSGHSSWSAYTMIYLALYIHKRMTRRGSRLPRHLLQFTALMLSWFTALSRVSDFKHHWSDVLAGYWVGGLTAVLVWLYCTDLVKIPMDPVPHHDISLTRQQKNVESA